METKKINVASISVAGFNWNNFVLDKGLAHVLALPDSSVT